MAIERKRPIKMFEVVIAHGPYRVGDKIQPTGMYRDVLLRRGLIKELEEEEARDVAQPQVDRMIAPSEMMRRGRGRPRKSNG